MKRLFTSLGLTMVLFMMSLGAVRAAETSQTIAFRGCDATLTGTVDLRLRLFDAATGGNMVFEETQAGVAVDPTNCVAAQLGAVTPLTATLFTANPSLWVAFALDATPDTELGNGRTPVTANGYAFRAVNADNAQTFSAGAAVTGALPGALLTLNNTDPGGRGLIINAFQIGLTATGNGLGVYGEAVGVGVIGKGSIGVEGTSDAIDGRGVNGVATHPTSRAAGVAGATLSSNSFAAGVFGRAVNGPSSGVFGQNDSVSDRATGVFGLATGNTGATVGVWGRTVSTDNNAAGVFGETTSTTGNSAGVWGRSSSVTSGAAGVYGESQTTFGENYGVYGRTSNGGSGGGVRGLSTGVNGNGVIGEAHNGSSAYGIWGKSSTGYAGWFDGKVKVNGSIAATVVQITGADFSEKFEVRKAKDKIEPGMVVAIDPKHPGQLTLSAQAYNRRVVGIISGAGGVQTGVLMGQPGTLADGDQPVALSGRVYCRADASNGPIVPGDFLTTSNLPGHAMKVTNYSKAQGAIIGKAMTGLNRGKGLVLVLVTLQ